MGTLGATRTATPEHGFLPGATSQTFAQVGTSTKLRQAGFRQRMTQRLAVGIAGAHWGAHEKYCLLDAFVSESRTAKSADTRSAASTRLNDWMSRVRRQNDVWALVYGGRARYGRRHLVLSARPHNVDQLLRCAIKATKGAHRMRGAAFRLVAHQRGQLRRLVLGWSLAPPWRGGHW